MAGWFALAALGGALFADDDETRRRRKALARSVLNPAKMNRLLNRLRLHRSADAVPIDAWHFAMSWDWHFMSEHVRGAGVTGALEALRAEILKDHKEHDYGHPRDHRYRIYAIIRGGHRLLLGPDAVTPFSHPGSPEMWHLPGDPDPESPAPGLTQQPVHFVYEGEKDVIAISVHPDGRVVVHTAGNIIEWPERLYLGPEQTEPLAGQLEKIRAAHMGVQDAFEADMVIAGGRVVHIARYREHSPEGGILPFQYPSLNEYPEVL
jgi:hypothetical protein